MNSLLVGHTGFVGSNISRQTAFSANANSSNFTGFSGKKFDLIVFAAAPAVKWWANANPDADEATIKALMTTLRSMSADRFVLISTVDVYPTPQGVDEHTTIEPSDAAYGRNRKWLEDEVRGHFPVHHVLRLPALFGPGLKKNILFDLIRDNMVEKINLDSSFQWYPMSRIWNDIQQVIEANLELVNLMTEPVPTRDIHDRYFPTVAVGDDAAPAASYDVKTVHASTFDNAPDGYIMDGSHVLDEIGRWLRNPELAS